MAARPRPWPGPGQPLPAGPFAPGVRSHQGREPEEPPQSPSGKRRSRNNHPRSPPGQGRNCQSSNSIYRRRGLEK